jgi:tRNA dimethylallyltransferase
MLIPLLIAGPTASGKSALALALAQRFEGAVINADSQQIYRDWRILSARPTPEDETQKPHFLYGHVALDAEYSVGTWLRELTQTLAECRDRGLRPVITGGTGLYFKALTEGLAPIPPIPADIRANAEAELQRLGVTGLAAQLAARDPETAAIIDQANPSRVLRAWEVFKASGAGLAEWRRRTGPPLLALDRTIAIVLTPPRDRLYARCDARFGAMLEAGALEEAAKVRALDFDPMLPGMKPLGAPELMAHLAGDLSLDEAATRAKTATRNYAKRQFTWARNQMLRWKALSGYIPAENLASATELVENAG